ncbi:MAG: hypothetical protein ABH834_06695, partial [Candidatus Altiarchaeota archaeon]
MRKIIFFTILVLCLAGAASAISLKSIDLSRDDIDVGNKFKIEVEVKYPESNHQIEFFVDDYMFSSRNVGSGTEKMESSEWNWDVDELNCGEHVARAELRRGNISLENLSMAFTVGNLPVVSFDPELPQVGKNMIITVMDAGTGNPISGVKADIFNTASAKTQKITSDSFGRISYHPTDAGKYRMEFSGKDYCGKREFSARKTLIIDGPNPGDPVVGELVSIALPSSVGVKLYDENGKLYLLAETKIGGGANFTVKDPGTYTIVMGELSSQYWGVNKTIVVSSKDTPRITITPGNPVVGEPVTINAESAGEPLEDAVITVTAPDNSFDAYTTAASGSIVYTPTAIGKYSVIVEKERCQTVDKNFESKNKLAIVVSPLKPTVGESVVLTVKNQQGSTVGDVSLTINGESKGSTDAAGVYATKFTEPGEYIVTASKTSTLYWDDVENITVSGSLSMSITPENVEIGDAVKIIVSDNSGTAVSTQLSVTKPDGASETLTSNTYTPQEAGEYTIKTVKQGYREATGKLTASPHPLNLEYMVNEKTLKILVTSRGEPVSDINVKLTNPYATESLTDADGMAIITITGSGDYTFEVNKQNTKPAYEAKTIQEQIVK